MDCQSFEGQGLFHGMSWLLSHNRLCKTKFSLELTIKWNSCASNQANLSLPICYFLCKVWGRLDFRRLPGRVRAHFPEQRLVIEPRFEEDKCLNSYEIVAKLAKIFKHCLAPCKVIQILQFRKFFFVKSCILEISSRGMRGGGRLYTGCIWNPQSCQRLESGIQYIRNPQHGIQTPIMFCLTYREWHVSPQSWSDYCHSKII